MGKAASSVVPVFGEVEHKSVWSLSEQSHSPANASKPRTKRRTHNYKHISPSIKAKAIFIIIITSSTQPTILILELEAVDTHSPSAAWLQPGGEKSVLLLSHAHFIGTSTYLTIRAAWPMTNYTVYTINSPGWAYLFQETTSTCKAVFLQQGRKPMQELSMWLPVIIEIILIIHASLPCHMAVQRPSSNPLTLLSCVLWFGFLV